MARFVIIASHKGPGNENRQPEIPEANMLLGLGRDCHRMQRLAKALAVLTLLVSALATRVSVSGAQHTWIGRPPPRRAATVTHRSGARPAAFFNQAVASI